ncbi:MAG TPA: hypothetical protein VGD48_18685 [Kutzneria sp.]|jgi:hypothetical protein
MVTAESLVPGGTPVHEGAGKAAHRPPPDRPGGGVAALEELAGFEEVAEDEVVDDVVVLEAAVVLLTVVSLGVMLTGSATGVDPVQAVSTIAATPTTAMGKACLMVISPKWSAAAPTTRRRHRAR